MGLDMYAYAVSKHNENGDFEISEDVENKEEIAYWRKFNALHGWMEDLYNNKGGNAESFNCIPLRLTDEDLNSLIDAVNSKSLTPRAGFFFGEQKIYPEDIQAVYEFVGKAKAEIMNGNEIYYNSWW